MRWRLTLLAVVVVACAGTSGDLDRRLRITVDGTVRTFDLFLPAGTAAPVPLVIVFHGFASSAEAVRRASGFDDAARNHGFAVAYPQALGLIPAWRADAMQGDEDLRFIEALIGATAGEIDLEPEAVFVVGFSNGGAMALRVGCERPDLVGGVGSVAAAVGVPSCRPDGPMPLMAFHGTADPIVPYWGVTGDLAPVEQWVAEWATSAGCESETTKVVADDVKATTWAGCRAPVELFSIAGGGHGWPGPAPDPWWGTTTDAIDASDLLVQFFASVPSARERTARHSAGRSSR